MAERGGNAASTASSSTDAMVRDVETHGLNHRKTLRHYLSGRAPDDPPKDTTSSLLISGAAAGGVSKLLTAPIDRVKIMYQVSSTRAFSIRSGIQTAAEIVRTAGVSGLWRGNSIAVLRDVPYAAILFSSYSLVEESLCGLSGRPKDIWSRSLAGCLAGAISTTLTYPLDMLRARFGADWQAKPKYSSYAQGVREIVRTEGPSALFAGIRPTLIGIMPYSALSFAAFETLKAILKARAARAAVDAGEPPVTELRVRDKLAAGGTAGLFAQTCTYPLHVVRRRMQAGTGGYSSTWHALSHIYTHEGVSGGLFKGLTLTFVKGPLQSAIGFTVNDQCKRWLREKRSIGGA